MKSLTNLKIDLKSFVLGGLITFIVTIPIVWLVVYVSGSSTRLEKCTLESSQVDNEKLQKGINSLKNQACENIVIEFENQHNIFRFLNGAIVGSGFVVIVLLLFLSKNGKESINNTKLYILSFSILFYSLRSFIPLDKYIVATALLAGEGRKLVNDLQYKTNKDEQFNKAVEKYNKLYDLAINQWQLISEQDIQSSEQDIQSSKQDIQSSKQDIQSLKQDIKSKD